MVDCVKGVGDVARVVDRHVHRHGEGCDRVRKHTFAINDMGIARKRRALVPVSIIGNVGLVIVAVADITAMAVGLAYVVGLYLCPDILGEKSQGSHTPLSLGSAASDNQAFCMMSRMARSGFTSTF